MLHVQLYSIVHLFSLLFPWGHFQISPQAFRFVGQITTYDNLLTHLEKFMRLVKVAIEYEYE